MVPATEVRRRSRKELMASGTVVTIIYASSVGLLLVAELALSRASEATTFGEYQYVRQAIPLVVACVVFGVDQALTRDISSGGSLAVVRRLMRSCAILSIPVSLLAAVLSWKLYGLSLPAILTMSAAPTFVVITELAAAVCRAQNCYAEATVAQQGYRLFAGIGVLILVSSGWGIQASSAALLAGAVIVALPLAIRVSRRTAPRLRAGRAEIRRVRVLGAGFGISMFSMALIDWIDQAAVAQAFGSLASSGLYVGAKLVTVYPFVTVASVLGFMIMPEMVKRRKRITRRVWRGAMAIALGGSILLWVLASWALNTFSPMILGRDVGIIPVSILSAVGALRICYLLPSGVVGALGSAKLLAVSGLTGLIAAGMGAATIFLLRNWDPTSAGSTGLLVATVVRLLLSIAAADKAVAHFKRHEYGAEHGD
jgi:O-antigen/teichoic acid export membrane protein